MNVVLDYGIQIHKTPQKYRISIKACKKKMESAPKCVNKLSLILSGQEKNGGGGRGCALEGNQCFQSV